MTKYLNENQLTSIQGQRLGLEIEMTGRTRRETAELLGQLFATDVRHVGGYYDKYVVRDSKDRKWTVMSDGSIHEEMLLGSGLYRRTSDGDYSVELVTPTLPYEELGLVRVVVDLLKANGLKANESCGIHCHVSCSIEQTVGSLQTLLKLAEGREAMIYEALGITPERESAWCSKVEIADKLDSISDMEEFWDVWYSSDNSAGRCGGYSDRDEHYNSTRYHGINLHSLYQDKGVEFRYFNGTLDSGLILVYAQFCAALNAFSQNNAGEPIKFYDERKLDYTQAHKKALFGRFLRNRLGMSGPEFSYARKVLLKNFC